jgi:glycosyltransferase involved in cell wall biosynthesis
VTADDRPRLSVVHVVVTDSFAGVERYVCQVVNELTARGHRVATIGGDPSRMRAELDHTVQSRPARTLVRAAVALARQGRVDIVHLHMTAAEGAAWLARPLQRAPLVATRHFARDRGSSAIARALSRVTSRTVVRDIAISKFVAETISGDSTLIPNGVPSRVQAELESSTVVMLQRLNAEKSPDVGIRAWAASGLGDRGWRLVIAGDGELRPSLVGLVNELGVADSVEFLGHVTQTDDLLARASMLLAPAPEEPFGLSVVEAMAHGLPVVAARGGAHVETVGEDGSLFAPGDPAAAAAALVALSMDRSLRLRVGSGLRRRQQDRYSLSTHVDHLEDLYRQVIGQTATYPPRERRGSQSTE